MHDKPNNNSQRPQSIDLIGGELRAAMASDAAAGPGHRRKRIGWSVAIAGVVTACLLAVFALPGGDSEKPFTVESAVAAVAQAVYDTPREHPDEYLYVKSTSTFNGGRSVVAKKKYKWVLRMTSQSETWLRPKSAAWTRTQVSDVGFPTEHDRASAAAAQREMERDWKSRHPNREMSDRTLDFLGEATPAGPIVCRISAEYAWMIGDRSAGEMLGADADLPKTAKGMYKFLARRVKNHALIVDKNAIIWSMIDTATRLSAGSVEPEQRSALIGALALIPGTETYGATTDPTGRPAIGFSRTADGMRQRLFFDRETGLTSYSDVVATNHKPVRGVSSWRLDRFEYVKRPPHLKATKRRSVGMLLTCPYNGPKGHYIRSR